MDVNLTDHRHARRQSQWAMTRWRLLIAVLAGIVLCGLQAWWWHRQGQVLEPARQAAEQQGQQLQWRQQQWETQTGAWAEWEAQRQAWVRLGHESQTPLRIWHWLGRSTTHGVHWHQWQQEGSRWTVSGEANSLMDVREWLVSGVHRPIPLDREVAVSQSQQLAGGRIVFSLTWEELP